MKTQGTLVALLATLPLMAACGGGATTPIDRHALLDRNNPQVTAFDSLASLTVGNGNFAYTVDATGLQTFPERYSAGVPLGTQSSWGWHSYPNPENYRIDEAYKEYDFGHGHKELYATQFNEPGRAKEAADWFRKNPHRLHLGCVGLALPEGTDYTAFTDVHQTLQLEQGRIESTYKLFGKPVEVTTACSPQRDEIAIDLRAEAPQAIVIRMPYPTGGHADDACLWQDDASLHYTYDTLSATNRLVLTHWFPTVEMPDEFGNTSVKDFTYRVAVQWADSVTVNVERRGDNAFVLTPSAAHFSFTCEFAPQVEAAPAQQTATDVIADAENYWHNYWYNGAVVDFSQCTNELAPELERRVVLSQYLLAVNCAGNTPPQETGLTYNSWFGKFHMEMIWWHQAQFALWGHPELLDRTLGWYKEVEPVARLIAQRQGFKGVRWMKMTDPSGLEAPSKVGSFLIWQQPHPIYLAELLYRANPSAEVLDKYYDIVQETAEFMADFATYDTLEGRYVLKGAIPAQETLRAAETVNSPFELSQWHFALDVAQQWRERRGLQRNMEWEELIDKLSPLAYINDSVYSAQYGPLYLAAETATDTYRDIRFTQDHMAVLGALGIFPKCNLVREDYMRNTLHWVWDNWNWGKTWGWDYPMTSMCACRLGEAQLAVDALVVPKRTNTYLVSGHNYQDSRLRLYLPGNGGLLTAVALMCAGWDGCTDENPGFPKDGTWNVRWEGLKPLP
jgi:hypothetical protein